MLNRLTNLFVLFTFACALLIASESLWRAWGQTEAWEQEWILKPDANAKHSADLLIRGMRKASDTHNWRDATALATALEADYMRSGIILVRLSQSEILHVLESVGSILLLLTIPISTNYIRHGKARLWNRA
jgi:hypothetical protein